VVIWYSSGGVRAAEIEWKLVKMREQLQSEGREQRLRVVGSEV
jgi:hypothetical protein